MSRSLSVLLDGLVDDLPGDIHVSGLTLDSRQAREGDAFLAVAGQDHHGLEFLDQALQRGCAAVLWEPADDMQPAGELAHDSQLIRVPGLSSLVGTIADRFFRHPSRSMTVVGITGTNGKSSCVHFMAQSLNGVGTRCGTLGTLGVGIHGHEVPATHTTPDAIVVHRELGEMRRQGAEVVTMEVSSHALDQGRVNGVRFDAAVFTNLTRDHLDYHGDMNHYQMAKSRLFAAPGLRFAILNADDPASAAMARGLDPTVERIEYGIEAGAVRATHLRLRETGIEFSLELPGGNYPVAAGVLGRFNAYNLLAVAATLLALGWDGEGIARALSGLRPVPGRMNLLGGGHQPLVVVDYAHTPDALDQSLQAVRAHISGALVCVFGCGGDRDVGKRPMMAAVAEARADHLVITDDNPRSEDGDAIVQDILTGLENRAGARVERDRAAAIALAIQSVGAGDAVVVAGKGHETYQEVNGRRNHFDDREVAARILGGAS